MRALIPIVDGSPLRTIQGFLGQMIRADVVEAVLAPMVTAAGTVTPALVADADLLRNADPLAPVLGLNIAPEVGHVSVGSPRGRIAAVLRSCEMRALVELVKLRQADMTDLVTIGIDCPGTFSVPDYLAIQQEPAVEEAVFEALVAGAEVGTIGARQSCRQFGREIRVACQMCEKPHASGTDVTIELFGAELAQGIPVSLPDEMAEKLGLGPGDDAEGKGQERRAELVAQVIAQRSAIRDARFEAMDERLQKEGIATVFAACVRCHNCMTACPVCYCRTCLFLSPTYEHEPMEYMNWAKRKGACRLPADTMMFHLTRLNHMALSCIGCGMCTSACPTDLPVGEVFRTIAHRLQDVFEYEPGRDVDETLPLVTFRENEWLEVGEE